MFLECLLVNVNENKLTGFLWNLFAKDTAFLNKSLLSAVVSLLFSVCMIRFYCSTHALIFINQSGLIDFLILDISILN